ncbi:alpha-L-fucosidase [Olsenella profusa]|uniref:alpha-L-fucosidase n=1 Tax=Olsenella profusa TaxID=138595 RepID=A0ABS2F3X8_9ACTN|nr:alpha-L-fucosidase [Olsenella profusa]MBM6775522.1 alpha-L-fucosidase [Olsenella profusa]
MARTNAPAYRFDRARYDERMRWWLHDRFGMFVHWGIYAIPARGEWVRSVERMPDAAYTRYATEFTAPDFDPHAWARAAREAGMRYVVLTAKHHDGFCLFDSALTDFKVTNTPLGRDVVREFLDAARAEGLRAGLYFSLIDWHHPDFPQYADRNAPLRNDPVAGCNDGRDWDRYLRFMHGQVRELCENYGKLDLLWFDFSYDDLRGERWGATELMRMVRELQPDVVVNNRLEVSGEGFGSLAACRPTPYHGDFVTPEQIVPPRGLTDAEGRPLAWEACVTMNDHWGYCAADMRWKPADLLVRKLVECVSKGGNLILNVGPDARGRIPEASLRTLAEVGRWMRDNGESVYGCGPAAGGPVDAQKPEVGRLTRRGNTYYFHLMEGSVGPVPLLGVPPERIVSVRRMADGSEVPLSRSWTHSDYPDVAFADLGGEPGLPDPVDTVLAVRVR